jgi:hypothetical protein
MGETQDGIHPKLGTTTKKICRYELATYVLCHGGYIGLGLEVRRLWAKGVWGLLATWVYGYGY